MDKKSTAPPRRGSCENGTGIRHVASLHRRSGPKVTVCNTLVIQSVNGLLGYPFRHKCSGLRLVSQNARKGADFLMRSCSHSAVVMIRTGRSDLWQPPGDDILGQSKRLRT